MTSLTYSQYLQFKQNPTCIIDGPTGPTGPIAPTGPTGPQGIPGANGISTGLIYYFTQSGNTIGPTGSFSPGGMSITPGPNPGPNPLYTTPYNGWFFEQTATGTTVQIARFTSAPINQSVIPRGNWTFYNNIYSFVGPTRPVDPTTAVPNVVYVKAYLSSGATIIDTSVSSRGVPINGLDDTTVVISQEIPNDISVPTPSSTYIIVEYYIQSIASGNVAELWTQGDSVGYVVTTLATQGGSTGATGPTGAPGLPGAQGPAGPVGPTYNPVTVWSSGVIGPTGADNLTMWTDITGATGDGLYLVSIHPDAYFNVGEMDYGNPINSVFIWKNTGPIGVLFGGGYVTDGSTKTTKMTAYYDGINWYLKTSSSVNSWVIDVIKLAEL